MTLAQARAPRAQLSTVKPYRDKLDEWLDRGKKEAFSVVTSVNPAIAERLLARNEDNRPVRWKGTSRCVEAYAAAMRRGEWVLNGENIVVSDDGKLNDGQHRLWAVIDADVQIPATLMFGVKRETRHTLDQGAARTLGHVLAMRNELNTTQLATALHFLWCYEQGQSFNYRFSPDEMIGVLDTRGEIREFLNPAARLAGEFRGSPGYLAGAAYICAQVNPDVLQEMVEAATTGLGIKDEHSPVYLLRKRFQAHLSKRDKLTNVEQAALFIKVFNALVQRRSMSNLRWRVNGPEAFPTAGG